MTPNRARAGAAVLVIAALCSATLAADDSAAPQPSAGRYAGRPLADALLELAQRGLRIVFTSALVPPELTVTAEPSAIAPRAILDELLRPHGLEASDGPGGRVVVVRAGRAPALSTAPPSGDDDDALVLPAPVARFTEELVVLPSRFWLIRPEPVADLGLGRDELVALPHLGEDLFRAISLFPGATANDISAQFHIRGGRRDETRIVLDGQELYDAFHLQDYDRALSFVAPATLASAALSTGGFAARHGDRMSGVLDLTTLPATDERRLWLGLSFVSADLGGFGRFAEGRGGYLFELRRGATDLIGRLLNSEDPHYWDGFGKLDYRFGERHTLFGSFLRSGDELRFAARDSSGGDKRFATAYDSSYGWIEAQTLIGERLLLETALAQTELDRLRQGREVEPDAGFLIRDERDVGVAELRQAWHFGGRRHDFDWGFSRRRFDARYDYFSQHQLDNPLAAIRHDGREGEAAFDGTFRSVDDALFVSNRFRLAAPLTVELGARWDRHGLLDQTLVSPRFNLAYAFGRSIDSGTAGVARLAWGRFGQSQRPYELQVEDGESSFHRLERAEQRIAGLEWRLSHGRLAGGIARLELYRRDVDSPRPRYENLFEPVNNFPEIEPDRVLVAPERSRAEGLELFVHGPPAGSWRWWVGYTWAKSLDRIDGAWVPRLFDERQSLVLDLDGALGRHWRMNLAWRIHTGWPTTPLAVVVSADDEGELQFEPSLGELNSDRLSAYHRLDLRLSRRIERPRAAIDLFVDVQNLYNRKNVSGFDYEIDDETGALKTTAETWAGLLPSIGVRIQFGRGVSATAATTANATALASYRPGRASASMRSSASPIR